MKIINRTESVLEINNSLFSCEIPIGEEIIIADEQLYGDYELTVKYFSLNSEKSHVTSSWKIQKIPYRKTLIYEREKEYKIPALTTVNVKGYDEIIIEGNDISAWTLLPFVVNMNVKRVRCKANGKKIPCKVEFLQAKSKRKFIIHSILSNILKFLSALLFIGLTLSGFPYKSNDDYAFVVVLAVISCLVVFSFIMSIGSTLTALKCRVKQTEDVQEE